MRSPATVRIPTRRASEGTGCASNSPRPASLARAGSERLLMSCTRRAGMDGLSATRA